MIELVAMGLDEFLEDDLELIPVRLIAGRVVFQPPQPRLPPAQEPVVLADQLPVLVVFGSTYRHFIPRVELVELRTARLADELSEDGLELLLVLQLESKRAPGGGHRSMCRCLNVYGFPQSKPGDRALDIVILCNREIALSVDLHHPEGWMP